MAVACINVIFRVFGIKVIFKLQMLGAHQIPNCRHMEISTIASSNVFRFHSKIILYNYFRSLKQLLFCELLTYSAFWGKHTHSAASSGAHPSNLGGQGPSLSTRSHTNSPYLYQLIRIYSDDSAVLIKNSGCSSRLSQSVWNSQPCNRYLDLLS